MKYDVIVIGSGLSGLAAGIRLAMFDKKVLIIEKHTVVGGLNSYYTRKNRTIDVGLHAMTNYSPKGGVLVVLGERTGFEVISSKLVNHFGDPCAPSAN